MLRRARAAWPFDVLDVLAFVGLSIVGVSLAAIWLPLGGVVFGAAIIVYAFLAALPPRAQP